MTDRKRLLAMADRVLRLEAESIALLRERLDDRFVRAVELMHRCRGRVIVTGMGKSGLICRKIAATLSSTGTSAWFLHPAEAIHGDLGAIRNDDVVVALSHSGETDELIRLLESIRRIGARLIAITGATTTKKGKFALADGGTIFLDEIGTMSPTLQSKLLRVLQEREVEPLGSERTEKIDVRVIAATNRDLRQMVADGKFQEDLFYRLNVIPIEIPPLRERRDDIPALVEHFVKKHAQRTGRRYDKMDEAVLTGLQQYDWPGNVRELENTIERAVVLSPGPVITARAVSVLGGPAQQPAGLPSLKLRQNIEWVERETIRRALENAGGVKKDAAELMGISQRALSYYLAKYRLES